MNFPIGLEDVKIVQGSSGRGLQVTCGVCGAVNWSHLEMRTALWACRNCEQVFTQYFPGLVEKFLAQEKEAAASAPQAATT
jgi:ribosomal protein L37AE/L43A